VTSTPSDWIKLASFSSVFEAELAVAALETARIPALVIGHQKSGIFGAGFQGPVIGGVDVRVPTSMLDDAWEIIASMSPRADKPQP
jgi:Putative prokaryotic signal transducing protein